MTTRIQRVLAMGRPSAAGAACLFLLMLSVAGCSGGMTGTPGGPPAPPLAASATLSFCDAKACTPGSSFSTASVSNLAIRVSWSNMPSGEHSQTMRILMPDGQLYQRIERSFLVPQGSQAPIVVQEYLPVATGHIGQRGLTGNWSVEILRENGQRMALSTLTFNP